MRVKYLLSTLAIYTISLPVYAAEERSLGLIDSVVTLGVTGSLSYNLIIKLKFVLAEVSLRLYDNLAAGFQPLFIQIASLMFIFMILKWMQGKADIMMFMRVIIGVSIANIIVFTPGVFKDFIYEPIIKIVFEMPAYIVNFTADKSENNSLIGMFSSIEDASRSVMSVALKMMGEAKWYKVPIVWLQGAVFYFLFLAMLVAFTIIFALSIISIHIMIIVLPFAIALAPFPQVRGLFFNVLRAISGYALVPFFLAIITGFTLFLMNDVVQGAEAWGADSGQSEAFFIEAFFVGVLSIFLYAKAPEFSTQVVGGTISTINSTIAAAGSAKVAASLAGSGAKAGAKVAKAAGGAVAKGYSKLKG
jgi:hypothetical protein